MQNMLETEVAKLEKQRDELVQRSMEDLPKKSKKIFALMDFLPKKIDPLFERYNILTSLLEPDGAIDDIFNQLESINNKKRNQLFRKEKWMKSLLLTMIVAEEVRLLVIALKNAYYADDEIDFNQHIAAFDIKVRHLGNYADVEAYIKEAQHLTEDAAPVPDSDIAEAYREIKANMKELEKLMVSISSQKHIDHLVNKLKNELLHISDERKKISLEIMNIDDPLAATKLYLDKKEYLLDVFWKHVLLTYDEFSSKLKGILHVDGFDAWDDARKRYAVLYEIKQSALAFSGVFKVLVESYDQALVNYRKAKRAYHRYEDESAKRGLDAATLYSVEISELANKTLGEFILICDNFKKADSYIKNSNEFYKENLKLATELYTNLQAGLREWGSIFKRMYK